jgi:2C-methyl-D-erythritol 2,4-cyclodiphosphate synthase
MEKSLEKALLQHNFHADISYLSDDYLSGIALNKTESKIAVFKRFNIKEEFSPSIYNFNEILECSIKEDGDTITHTVSKSLIGRAMAGGVLFGGVGAAIGGMTAERIASEKIYRATLSITFDDIDYPIREVDFLNSKMMVDRNSELYQNIYNDLNKWHKTISVIIKRNEKELNSKTV